MPAKSSTSAAATATAPTAFERQQFQQIVGLDVSIRSLEIANKRLKLDRFLIDRPSD